MLPEHFQKWEWLREPDYLILLNENQGVCQAGIRREDLMLPDPPAVSYTHLHSIRISSTSDCQPGKPEAASTLL